MGTPIFQVDAFTSQLFGGNPAAIMPLERWLDDTLLQSIALENNLSETAFLVRGERTWELRWFTPTTEVDLCGHATLAAAHVLFAEMGLSEDAVVFETRSGDLRVSRHGDVLTLDFPAKPMQSAKVDVAICDALGLMASEAYVPVEGRGATLCVFEFESDVAGLSPDFGALKQASERPVIATAPGDNCDVVSRFFGPQVGIDEDPVTGSAHCILVPYWCDRLQMNTLACRQISSRGGELACELRGDRVFMSGSAVTFMRGETIATLGRGY